jgi:hypothetical protein
LRWKKPEMLPFIDLVARLTLGGKNGTALYPGFLAQSNPPVQVRGKGDGKDAKKTTHLESYQP